MEQLYATLSDFIKGIDINSNTLLLISLGLLLLVVISAFVRSLFTYEVKLLRVVNRLNHYFMREPYVNEENLIRFNKKMKNVPKTLRYTWQEFMLNRDKAPSEYMNTTTCVDQPSKASAYSNTAKAIGTYSIIIAVLSFIFSLVSVIAKQGAGQTSLSIADYFFDFFFIPVLIVVLGYLFVLFMRARHTSINADLYYSFHEFERNINKACTTLPQFIDYEVLFTKREIKDGIPVLQEYLEKRALQEKIEQEEAMLSAQDFEQFNFEEIGVENSLLLDRALLESEKYFRVKTDLYQKIKSKETEMQNYQKNFDEVTKDYERKAQVLRETLQQLTDQINNTTIKIEANYMKKRLNEEQQRLQQLEKEYELSTNRFQKQQAELQEEISTYKEEVARRKQIMQDAMMAEGRTYAKKVYSVITADVQEQSRPYLEQMERIKHELEGSVVTLKNELQFKNNELANTNAKLEKAISEYQIRLVGLENIKQLKEYLTSAEYRDRLLKATSDDPDDKKLMPVKLTEKVEKLTKDIAEREKDLKRIGIEKTELEKRVKELNLENANLIKQLDKCNVSLHEVEVKSLKQVQELEEKLATKQIKQDNKKVSKLFGKKETAEKVEDEKLTDKDNKKPEVINGVTIVPLNEDLVKELAEVEEKPAPEKENKENDVNEVLLDESDKKSTLETEKATVEEVEKPIEKTVEKTTEKAIENPDKNAELKLEKVEPVAENAGNKTAQQEAGKIVETKEIVADKKVKPEDNKKPEKIVEKEEKSVEKTVEKPVEKTVEKPEQVKEEPKPKPNKLDKLNSIKSRVERLPEGTKSQTVKVEKKIATKPEIGKQEILELTAIKRRIEAESLNLQKQKQEYQNAIVQTLDVLDSETVKPKAEPASKSAKNKIGSSLNTLVEKAKKVDNKTKKNDDKKD